MKIHITILALCVFGLGASQTSAQVGLPAAELCNGKDDNGDGAIDDGLDCSQHYLAYRLQTAPFTPVSVFLDDQFSPNFFKVLVERPVALLNPTHKRHSGLDFPIKRPELHYVAYTIKPEQPFPGTSVWIDNQFEQHVIKVDQPTLLLAPAAKKKLGAPSLDLGAATTNGVAIKKFPIPTANHYLCYNVEPATFQIPVYLADQFQARPFQVVERKRLCNPVAKEHSGGVFPIIDQQDHLTCYRVLDPIQKQRSVLLRDQFLGLKQGVAFEEREICVPTIKKHL